MRGNLVMRSVVAIATVVAFGCVDGPAPVEPDHAPVAADLRSTSSGAGGPRWIELNPAGTPPAERAGHSAVLDASSNRLIVFGGRSGGVLSTELWILTNANGMGGSPTWIQVNAQGGPPLARAGHAAVYDPGTNRMVIFAGTTENFRLNDVWVLTNANATGAGTPTWIRQSPGGPAPTPRVNVSGIYDPASNRFVIFGGEGPFGGPPPNVLGDTWVLTNANGTGAGAQAWIQLSPTGPAPAARTNSSAAYDDVNNRMIVFGGSATGGCVPLNDVWVLTHANGLGGAPAWSQLSSGATQPQARLTPNIGYRSPTNRLVIFGGAGSSCVPAFNDVWVLSGITNGSGGSPAWRELSPAGGPPPARLAYATNAYDAQADRLVVFGGNPTPSRFGLGITGFLNDVWVLANADGLMPVSIDIKPGSDPNAINSRSRGRIPVAILSNSDFDAPNEVNESSLTFGRTGGEESLAFCAGDGEDVNADGMLDQVCHFDTQDAGFQRGDSEGILRGQTHDGVSIEGRDVVRIVR